MRKLTEDQRDLARVLFTKAFIPCDEIASRLGCSRQSVHAILRSMDVDTTKRKIAVPCSQCGTVVMKKRSEFRKNTRHFCDSRCYNEFSRRPDSIRESFELKAARERCCSILDPNECAFSGYFISDGEVLVFKSRDLMLEWQRTGIPSQAVSLNDGKKKEVVFRGGRAIRVEKEGEQEDQGVNTGTEHSLGKSGDAGSGNRSSRGKRTDTDGSGDGTQGPRGNRSGASGNSKRRRREDR